MGLKRHEPHWEVTDDLHSFYKRTGIIRYHVELEWLGLTTYSFSGIFDESHRTQLEEFCKANPEYHLITSTAPGLLVNQYIPARDNIYFLARGDKNPNLALDALLHKSAELFMEEGFAEAFAMISDVDNRHKSK